MQHYSPFARTIQAEKKGGALKIVDNRPVSKCCIQRYVPQSTDIGGSFMVRIGEVWRLGKLEQIMSIGSFLFRTDEGHSVTIRNEAFIRPTRAMMRPASGTASGSESMFMVGDISFPTPPIASFSLAAAREAVTPLPPRFWETFSGEKAKSGVEVGDVAPYGAVQYLEKTGDGLTGDHQPSGAALKENIRQKLHPALDTPLTREMAKNAYAKATTIVMSDEWHKATSRTYGGRNTKKQIDEDADDLSAAAVADWECTVPELRRMQMDDQQIKDTWEYLKTSREIFYVTGKPGYFKANRKLISVLKELLVCPLANIILNPLESASESIKPPLTLPEILEKVRGMGMNAWDVQNELRAWVSFFQTEGNEISELIAKELCDKFEKKWKKGI